VSALSSVSLGSALPATTLPATTLPAIDPALEPENVRNGNQAAKNAYQQGLAFEDILVNQLAQEMTATVPGLSGDGDGLGGSSSDGSSGGSTGGLTDSSSGISGYASLLPQALSSSIMSGGGTGIAMQIARSIDPALDNPPATGKP
jgi:Rod binding domain-containing protein